MGWSVSSAFEAVETGQEPSIEAMTTAGRVAGLPRRGAMRLGGCVVAERNQCKEILT
jgi:hypothetical protein